MAPRAPARRPAPPQVLKAKLQPPNVDALALDRPHLIEELERRAGRPLTLLTADAGWGKTTLAAAFARRVHRPVVWYALMPSDGDLRVFGRHLLEGFRAEAPRFGASYARLLEETKMGARGAGVLGEAFAQTLAGLKGPPRLLVLDDLHAATSAADVATFLDALLRVLPPSVRVLATSRTPPPLALERMRVRGELFELDAMRLRLTREEIAQLLATALGREGSEAEIERLDAATAGWPTAVQLALEALRRDATRPLDEVLAELHVPDLELQAFFSAEVYRRLEPDRKSVV